MASFTVFGVNWPHEGDELIRNDDVHVSILDLLVVFVLLVIKSV